MKITGVLVDFLTEIAPNIYSGYVVYEKGKRVLYVIVLRAIYGMLCAALPWFQKFRSDLEQAGFVFNPYDPCVANCEVNGSQHTIRFHVDDLMSSHVDPKVNDEFYDFLTEKYGQLGPVKQHRGNEHDYLGVIYRFYDDCLELDMTDYVKMMLELFPIKFKETDTVKTPATDNLFEASKGPLLSQSKAEMFHAMVAKGLFVSKRARLDILPTVAILCTRVKEPRESDWTKLIRMMKYLHSTRWKTRCIETTGDISIVKWMIDASYGIHPDFKSHTGSVMLFDKAKGAIQAISRKQKLNVKSSTEAELVAVDDVSVLILWTKLFLEEQGYQVEKNIIYQDNQSAILLEMNGKKSSGKRTRAINIRYFFITDQVHRGNATILYCPTDLMIGDFMMKATQGIKFITFDDSIMNSNMKRKVNRQ